MKNKDITQRKFTNELISNLSGWYSYHYQSIRRNGNKADLRIVYKEISHNKFKLLGFGDRHNPDIYVKLGTRQLNLPFFHK